MSARFTKFLWLAVLVSGLLGCRRDMSDQPAGRPLRESKFFADGMASRPLPAHTVAQEDDLLAGEAFRTGMVGTNLVTDFPLPMTREFLERGRARFEINCVPCHSETGEGNGIIVQRGFPAPPSYHIQRLRDAPVGHFFDVMTRGYGAMLPQIERVTASDRWAIAAYIRALQLSQHAARAEVPAEELAKLQAMP